MTALNAAGLLIRFPSPVFESGLFKLGFLNSTRTNAIESDHKRNVGKKKMLFCPIKAVEECPATKGSTNIAWHKSLVEKRDREQLLQQNGCVIWITGLSGSGKSTLACALSQGLHLRGKLSYILDGDNVRHGLNSDLSFNAQDRAENIRRVGELAKLFADAGIICIVCLISPYKKDRDACRALLPEGDFIEVFLDVPLQVCESRDPKGLYKLARVGKIKYFTGIDHPYEPPLNSEIVLHQKENDCPSPCVMADTVIKYLEEKGYLKA